MTNKIIVVADVHLSPTSAQRNQLFFQFLEQLPPVKALFILGDLFDAWIGDDDDSDYVNQCRQYLKNAGIPIFIQRGNRDFMLGLRWFKQTTSTLLPDWYVFNSGEKKFLMTHGDLLVDNQRYLRSRNIITIPLIKFFLYQLPFKTRQKLAKKLRDDSDGGDTVSHPNIEKIKDNLLKYSCNTLIYGHFHQPHITPIDSTDSSDQSPLHCCLPHWQDNIGGYATITDGKIDLHSFP